MATESAMERLWWWSTLAATLETRQRWRARSARVMMQMMWTTPVAEATSTGMSGSGRRHLVATRAAGAPWSPAQPQCTVTSAAARTVASQVGATGRRHSGAECPRAPLGSPRAGPPALATAGWTLPGGKTTAEWVSPHLGGHRRHHQHTWAQRRPPPYAAGGAEEASPPSSSSSSVNCGSNQTSAAARVGPLAAPAVPTGWIQAGLDPCGTEALAGTTISPCYLRISAACGRTTMGPAPLLLLLLLVRLPQPKTTRGWQPSSAHHINYAIILGNVADALKNKVLVLEPFVAITLDKTDGTLGARALGAAVTPRRYRLPPVPSRRGRAWLTCTATPRRGTLHGIYRQILNALDIPLVLLFRAPRAIARV